MIPLKVAMIMTDLDDLGVQRVVINLYNHFDRTRVDPTLIVWHNSGKVANFLSQDKPVYETDPGLRKPRLLFRLFRYRRILAVVNPDVILSFVPVTNISMTLIRRFIPRRVPIVMCEHAFISRAFASGEYKGLFRHLYKMMFRRMYNKTADCLIMTAGVGKIDVVENWGIQADRIKIIYNPQDIADLQSRAAEPVDHGWFLDKSVPVLIAAGRLTKQKGFDRLLAAFQLVARDREVRLVVLGRGELEEELRQLTLVLSIADKVEFLGFQTNHLKYIGKSDLFILSSIWEAMPMVIAETMAVGTPIVSFDCPSGPFEMLDGGDCGFLVSDQDVQALAEKILYALDNPAEAQGKAAKALAKVRAFDVAKITAQYESVLQSTVSEKA